MGGKHSKDLGKVSYVQIKASGSDGWLITKFEVKSDKGPWQTMGTLPRWLDGKPYDHSPYDYPYSDRITLHDGATGTAKFPSSWGPKTKGGCFCSGACSTHGSSSYVAPKGWCVTRDNCISKTGGKTNKGHGWDGCVMKGPYHVKIRATTGTNKYSESGQLPKMSIHFASGHTYNGHVHPAGKGKSKTTIWNLGHHIHDLGKVRSVQITASGTDGWLITKFKVKSGSRPWQTLGSLPRWFDGKPYDKSSYDYPYG